MESYSIKKQKILLEDYDYKQDLENRLLMSQFSTRDLLVLEEILYSSLTAPLKKIEKNLDMTRDELLPILIRLSRSGLFSLHEDTIIVDKEKRKYFEGQLPKFEPDFRPGMEFLQGLLKKVAIHVLPGWYSLPRLSDDIFESIVEKYLLTPQIFQRYLTDLTFSDPLLSSIVKELYAAPSLKIYGKDLLKKHNLSKEALEKALLLLEFHLVGFLSYEKVGDHYEEIVTPFYEWQEYAEFLKETDVQTVTTKVKQKRPCDFSYIEDLTALLNRMKKEPLFQKEVRNFPLEAFDGSAEYMDALIEKLCHLKLSAIVDKRLIALESATDFLDMSTEEKALFLYRHPFNRSAFKKIPVELATDRNVREAEKSIIRVLDKGWVYFDEFLRGCIVPLSETSTIFLKKQGKTWRYSLPCYTEEEKALIAAIVLDWLFEIGITSVGMAGDRICFRVTSFGRSLFGQ
ncbi:MAG: hypothetical protein RLZZ453_77 [Chlamydiota bacterium]|jgi:hypothetical protein